MTVPISILPAFLASCRRPQPISTHAIYMFSCRPNAEYYNWSVIKRRFIVVAAYRLSFAFLSGAMAAWLWLHRCASLTLVDFGPFRREVAVAAISTLLHTSPAVLICPYGSWFLVGGNVSSRRMSRAGGRLASLRIIHTTTAVDTRQPGGMTGSHLNSLYRVLEI